MSPTTLNDHELNLTMQEVIAMFEDRFAQAERRVAHAETTTGAYLARIERAECELTLTVLLTAQCLMAE